MVQYQQGQGRGGGEEVKVAGAGTPLTVPGDQAHRDALLYASHCLSFTLRHWLLRQFKNIAHYPKNPIITAIERLASPPPADPFSTSPLLPMWPTDIDKVGTARPSTQGLNARNSRISQGNPSLQEVWRTKQPGRQWSAEGRQPLLLSYICKKLHKDPPSWRICLLPGSTVEIPLTWLIPSHYSMDRSHTLIITSTIIFKINIFTITIL